MMPGSQDIDPDSFYRQEPEIPPAPPFRPLPKIVAPVQPPKKGALTIGDLLKIRVIQPNTPPFWRTYEVTLIDGGNCRLVTPDKRFAMNAEIEIVKMLQDLQGNAFRVETKK